jgi:hypothetical protein
MKKVVIVIFALIFWNANVFAREEIRSRFGFYITVPSNFIAVQNQNLDDLLKKYKGPNFDKKAFNDLMAGSPKQDMNIEYFFSPEMEDPGSHTINIVNDASSDFKNNILSISMRDLCPLYKEEYTKIFKKNIKQYTCELTNKFSPKHKQAVFLIHDSVKSNEGYLYQYQLQTSAGFTTFTATCKNTRSCELMNNYLSEMIRSIR